MRKYFISLILIILSTTLLANSSQEKYSIYKESCLQQSDYKVSNKELKDLLIEQVKRDAVEELFGAQLEATTTIIDGKLASDKIKQSAIGNVHIKGNPKFYNGKDFGQMCTKIEAYITQKDYDRYQPKKVSVKHFCYNNPEVSLKSLHSQANYAAYKKAITIYKPSLKNISKKQAEKLIHEYRKSNETLDIQTGVLCMDFNATLFPYELEKDNLINNENDKQIIEKSSNESENGLVVTFYSNLDHLLTKPLFTTYLHHDISLFKRSFLNNKLHKNKTYYIQLKGFLYSDIDRYASFKLKSDVYSAKLKINSSSVLNKNDPKGGVALKAGYNPIEIQITSSNSYDIELLEKQKDGSYLPLSQSKLFTRK